MWAAGFANLTCTVCVDWFSIVFYCSFQFEAWIDLLKILIMNKPMKRCILKRINDLEEMLKELTCEVEDWYEFGRRAREFVDKVGDTVGFNRPKFLPGCKFIRVMWNRSTLRSASSRCFASTILSRRPKHSCCLSLWGMNMCTSLTEVKVIRRVILIFICTTLRSWISAVIEWNVLALWASFVLINLRLNLIEWWFWFLTMVVFMIHWFCRCLHSFITYFDYVFSVLLVLYDVLQYYTIRINVSL